MDDLKETVIGIGAIVLVALGLTGIMWVTQ